MRYVKSFADHLHLDESVDITLVGVLFATMISNILYVLSGLHNRRFERKNAQFLEEKPELSLELKEITGNDIKIYSSGSFKNIAAATTDFVFYNKDLEKLFTHRELVAMLLHECSHVISRDIVKAEIKNLCASVPLFFFTGNMFLFISYFIVTIVLKKKVSRNAELSADSLAVKYGYENEGNSAHIKFLNKYHPSSMENEIDDVVHKQKFVVKWLLKLIDLFRTHPSLYARMKEFNTNLTPEEFVETIEKVKTSDDNI